MTLEELLTDADSSDIENLFTGSYRKPIDGWERIDSDLTGYDEGAVTTTYTVKHVESGRYFQYDHYWNSWADYDEPFDINNVIEVKPVEVTVIQYVPVSSS